MYGIEVKRADAPIVSQSMCIVLKDLKLDRIGVIYPGKKRYPLHNKIEAIPFDEILGVKYKIFKD